MGFKGTIFILLVALSIPLAYRRFVDDKLTKKIVSYDQRLKQVDLAIRDVANRIETLTDQAIQNLPSNEKIQEELVAKYHLAVKHINEGSKIAKLWIDENVVKKINELSTQKTDQKTAQVKKPASPTTTTMAPKVESKKRLSKCQDGDQEIPLWSAKDLAKFDGKTSEKVYLAFLGDVYDVSLNKQHYGKGGDYNVFAGRDASRAFVTGNFTHDLSDKLDDLDDSLLAQVVTWKSFYKTSYPNLGRLEGNFYNVDGCPTQSLKSIDERLAKIELQKQAQMEQQTNQPECNSEWNSDTKQARVWCTNKSGGIERDWAGVPRLLDGKCVCLNDAIQENLAKKEYKIYPGCDSKASECILKQ